MIEVLISPIVEACPTDRKEAAMSLLHSFYCWGHMGVVILSTVFFAAAGIGNWQFLAIIWAVLPLLNAVYFMLVPIRTLTEEGGGARIRDLAGMKMFWIIVILMICAGASEQAVSQWASAFAESALHVSKNIGDLAGPCAFALLMGIARILAAKYSDRFDLERIMFASGILLSLIHIYAVAGTATLLPVHH